MNDSQNPKAKDRLVAAILQDYVAMNRAALVHAGFVDYLATLEGNVCISVAEIKGKLEELEGVARDRLKVVEECIPKAGI